MSNVWYISTSFNVMIGQLLCILYVIWNNICSFIISPFFPEKFACMNSYQMLAKHVVKHRQIILTYFGIKSPSEICHHRNGKSYIIQSLLFEIGIVVWNTKLSLHTHIHVTVMKQAVHSKVAHLHIQQYSSHLTREWIW